MPVRIEPDQTARIGGETRDEEEGQDGEFGPQPPAFAAAKRDQGHHDARDNDSACQRLRAKARHRRQALPDEDRNAPGHKPAP